MALCPDTRCRTVYENILSKCSDIPGVSRQALDDFDRTGKRYNVIVARREVSFKLQWIVMVAIVLLLVVVVVVVMVSPATTA